MLPRSKAHKTDGNNTVKRYSLSSQKAFSSRRIVLSGFPYKDKLKDMNEINQYFAGDKIQCLLCGKSFKSLPTHIIRVHGMSVDQYKEKYGLPWGRGLVCSGTNKKMAKHAKQGHRSGRLMSGIEWMTDEQLEKLQASHKKQRKFCPAIKKKNLESAINGRLSIYMRTKRKTDSVKDKAITLRKAGNTYKAIAENVGMPLSVIYKVLENNRGFTYCKH